jgi:Domain of unknown function (DUF4340)
MKKNKTIFIITLLLLAVAIYFTVTKRAGTIHEELNNFAIEDTASINKIFLADKFGHSSTVVRQASGKWTVNGKYGARPDAINTLLYTMKNMEVRSPVGKAAYNTIMKDIAAKGIKVEIYQHDKLTKTYYVGTATQDQLGTFMYLENSSVPFVLHIPGFNGYLTTRYIVMENDWKAHTIFDLPMEQIASFVSEDFEQPQQSFIITKQAGGDFLLATYPDKKPVDKTEQNKLQGFMSDFKSVNYESESRHGKEQLDSIKSAGPFRTITLTDTKNESTAIKIYHMPLTEQSTEIEQFSSGNKLPYDKDRMLALINNDTGFVKIQYYVFGKFFKTPSDFLSNPSKQDKK